MAKRGWVCVSIDYRFMGDQPILDQMITDTQCSHHIHHDRTRIHKATAVAAATEDSLGLPMVQ